MKATNWLYGVGWLGTSVGIPITWIGWRDRLFVLPVITGISILLVVSVVCLCSALIRKHRYHQVE